MSDYSESQKKSRKVDIVFCIDGTGSMGPIMDNVKAGATTFKDDLLNAIKEGAEVESVRVRLITFRDYGVDEHPMEQTDWFELGVDDDFFKNSLDSIKPMGGGDLPENGLEALWYAMKSDFVTGPNDRQVIVLITDADALPMDARKSSPKYPSDVGTLEDLASMWMGLSQDDPNVKLQQYNKRLIMYAPAKTAYEELVPLLEGCMYVPVNPGKGLADVSFADVVKIIAASIGTK